MCPWPHGTVRLTLVTGDLAMRQIERFSSSKIKFALVALAVLGTKATCAATVGNAQPKMDCKIYEQQEAANLEAQKLADPTIRGARLDTVFYSARRNSCLASVFFNRGDVTYGGIVDISDKRMLWAKTYKGSSFTPANILAMDEQMDDAIQALEFAPVSSGNNHPFELLPLLFDRTMNTLPAIRNAFSETR
jgi:hypothetical protein